MSDADTVRLAIAGIYLVPALENAIEAAAEERS